MILIKLGTVMLVLGLAFVWTEFGVKNSWRRGAPTGDDVVAGVLGSYRTGVWTLVRVVEREPGTPQVVGAALALIVLMVLLSVVRTRWRNFRMPAWFAPYFYANPRRVSGD